MNVTFDSAKLAKVMNDDTELQKTYGPEQSRKIRARLDDLRDATSLEEMRNLPGRCHELTGNRAGQLAIDLKHPHRLIVRPDHDPPPTKDDGGLDWTQVTAVKVLEVVDYH